MSNSIWKTPDQKPEERRQILFYAGCGGLLNKGWYYTKNDAFGSYSSKNVQKWAYVDELFAQADKAERLQIALIQAKQDLEIAVDALNAIIATPLNSRVIHDTANKALEQIEHKE